MKMHILLIYVYISSIIICCHGVGDWSLSACCEHISNGSSLLRCANGSSYGKDVNNFVTIATFSTPNILDYASHTALINGYYATLKGYSFVVLGVNTGDDMYPEDRRWNKISAIKRLMLENAGQWIVFLDADLAILNDSLDISDVIRENPDAYLMMSRDHFDIGNTGFIIVKSCDWSIEFFTEWLKLKGSKNTYCDQHVFNNMYRKSPEHITIFPQEMLNTPWPAVENYLPSHTVLHLMGEPHNVRVAVFKHLSGVLCMSNLTTTPVVELNNHNEVIDKTSTTLKVSLARPELISLISTALRVDRDRLKSQISTLDILSTITHLDTALSGVKGNHVGDETNAVIRTLLSDVQQYQDLFSKYHEKTSDICDDRWKSRQPLASVCKHDFDEVASLHREVGSQLASVVLQQGEELQPQHQPLTSVKIVQVLYFHMDLQLQALFNSIYFIDVNKDNDGKFEDCFENILYLLDDVDVLFYHGVVSRASPAVEKLASSKQWLRIREHILNIVMGQQTDYYIDHKSAIFFGFRSRRCYYSLGDYEASVYYAKLAANTLGGVVAALPSTNINFPSFMVEFVNLALHLSKSYVKVLDYPAAYKWGLLALQNTELLYRDFDQEEHVIVQTLVDTHTLLSQVCKHLHNTYVEDLMELAPGGTWMEKATHHGTIAQKLKIKFHSL